MEESSDSSPETEKNRGKEPPGSPVRKDPPCGKPHKMCRPQIAAADSKKSEKPHPHHTQQKQSVREGRPSGTQGTKKRVP